MEFTSQMRRELEARAATPHFETGMSLMGAVRELNSLRDKNAYPARFQLLQYIESQPHVGETDTHYTVLGQISQKLYTFENLSHIQNVGAMDKAELKPYVEWLAERAQSSANARDVGYYRRVFGALMEKNAWMRYRESDQRYLNRLFNRHYAYEMGHVLGFTLQEMRRFLERVLPDEVYINKDAEDLAEAWAFANGMSSDAVREVLARYSDLVDSDDIVYDYIDIGNTHQLYEEAAAFEGSTENFVQWLHERRGLLEGRSRSAVRVYQNLLICAYLMMHALYDGIDAGDDPVGTLWTLCIESGIDMQMCYDKWHNKFFLPDWDHLDWKKAATEFNEFSEWAPSEKRARKYPRDFLTYLSVDKNGAFIVENTFSRIPQIMVDGKSVQKRDVLCLLWLIYTFAWEYVAPEDAANQLQDFIDLATGVLEQCNFTFYLPHLLEYAICRSLIVGGDMEDTYRSLIAQGTEAPLCEDLCVRAGNVLYGVRFYACEEYTFDDITAALYAPSARENLNVYTDMRKALSMWMEAANQTLRCGWEFIDDAKYIAKLAAEGRAVDLP